MKGTLRFAVDRMLGKLCKWLRILGMDALYVSIGNRRDIEALRRDSRIVLTRNAKWRRLEGVFFVNGDHAMDQLKEVIEGLDIESGQMHPLKMCTLCNQPLDPIPKHEVSGRVPDHVHVSVQAFHVCRKCGRIYWKGSHPGRMTHHMERFFGYRLFNGNSKEGEA